MKIWDQILLNLKQDKKVILLIVVENKGSSPGKQGFKMLVSEDGNRFGSIGGGTTEHKLVERAKVMISEGILTPEIHEQVHRTDEEMNKSGMICSGENKVLLYPLYDIHKDNIQEISGNALLGYKTTVKISSDQFRLHSGAAISGQYEFSEDNIYREVIGYRHTVMIFGGGHVGLALSKQMKMLDFHVKIYDNRKDLDTMVSNNYADEKYIIDYNEIEKYIPDNKDVYVIISSFSHTHDKKILSKLLKHDLKYLGMMGSKKKTEEIFQQLKEEGFSDNDLESVSSPIGVPVKSETPEEIAVSIAAEIIHIRNTK